MKTPRKITPAQIYVYILHQQYRNAETARKIREAIERETRERIQRERIAGGF